MRKILALVAAVAVIAAGSPVAAAPSPAKPADGHGRWLVGKNAGQAKLVTTRAYGGGFQFVGPGTAGVGATAASVQTSQHKAQVDTTNDVQSIFELAVEDSSQGNIVEIGYRNVNVCSSWPANPCLFVYSWVNNVGQGYGGITNPAWIDNPTEAVNAGTALAVTAGGASPTAFYEYKAEYASSVKCDNVAPVQTTATAGWLMYQQNVGSTRLIGCFPASAWTSAGITFDKVQLVQSFDEIAITGANPQSCSDMGSGIFGVATTPSAAQWVKNPTLTSPPAGVTAGWNVGDVKVTPASETPNAYRVNRNSSTDFRVGGPGWNAARTATGSVGSC